MVFLVRPKQSKVHTTWRDPPKRDLLGMAQRVGNGAVCVIKTTGDFNTALIDLCISNGTSFLPIWLHTVSCSKNVLDGLKGRLRAPHSLPEAKWPSPTVPLLTNQFISRPTSEEREKRAGRGGR